MQLKLALLLGVALVAAGCLGPDQLDQQNVDDTLSGDLTAITPVRDRANLGFVMDGKWSHTLENGTYGILEAINVNVMVEVPVGNGVMMQRVNMGLFLPDIPGCDLASLVTSQDSGTDVTAVVEAANATGECKVPVVADIGPYYDDGDVAATVPANRLGGFLIENLVPHGYAIAQVSVLGTGDSTGCMDLMGEVEQLGVQAAVDYLGAAAWSNGAVGLIGRSYDGSTPWEAAMVGSPYLKTVVPLSGLYGQHELMWRNGSAEFRGPGLLWGIYYIDAYSSSGGDLHGYEDEVTDTNRMTLHARQAAENTACPDSTTGGARHVATYGHGMHEPYWQERSFREEVLANYEGSVYFIHGMQDWNVDPHMAFPFYGELEAKGLEMKGLFGQWAHNYPDRLAEHEGCDGNDGWCAAPYSVRHDWAQDLLEWFDHYLKGTGAKPELHVEVQDDHGAWRIEETWPPTDAAWNEITLDQATVASGEPLLKPQPTDFGLLSGSTTGMMGPDLVLDLGTFDGNLRIAGLPQFHVTVTPGGAGGQVYAELRDGTDDRHLGHAIMDLRFAAGGVEPQPVAPGVPIVAQMEFEPMDVVLPEGHVLELHLSTVGMDYVPAPVNVPVQVSLGSDSVLRLPVMERSVDAFFAPPGEAAEPLL